MTYKLTSERTGKSELVYKDLGNYIFKEVHSCLNRPRSLIIKLKGVGFWYLRKKRMETILKHYPVDYEKNREDFSSDIDFLKHEDKKEIHDLFKERLVDYEKYLKIRRKIKNGIEILLEPDKREDGSQESSKTNS